MPSDAEKAAAKEELRKLRQISLTDILEQRYGATKDGAAVTARMKSTQATGKQQKFRLASGHHMNVMEDHAFYDLLMQKGGSGAIDLVMHLENLSQGREAEAIARLRQWYPDYTQFQGPQAPRPAGEAHHESRAPEPKVLPRFAQSSCGRKKDYVATVRNYLAHQRKRPPDVVDLLVDNNLAYPTEKTIVQLVDGVGSRELVDRLKAKANAEHYQLSVRDRDDRDQPYLVFHKNQRKPGIRVRMETRAALVALARGSHEFKMPGSEEVYRPEVVSITFQPELAFPILRYGSTTPVATSLRSLTGSHKQVVGPKTEGAFVLGHLNKDTKRLVLTESPIESACYFALKRPGPDTCIFGLSGSGNIEELYPFIKENGIEIVTAFNNEGAGRKFAKKVHESAGKLGIPVSDEFPPGGEVSVECEKDEENEKHLELIRSVARQNRLRYVEKEVPSAKPGGKQRIRMRIETHAEVWPLLEITDPSILRRAKESADAGRPTEGVAHFRESAEIQPVCKDWNDVLKGGEGRVFTTDYARTYDQRSPHMQSPPPAPDKTQQPGAQAETPVAPSKILTPATIPPPPDNAPDIGL